MKRIKYLILIMGMFCVGLTSVFAENNTYINKNEVVIDKTMVEDLKNAVGSDFYELATQEEYDYLRNIYLSNYSETSIIKGQRDLVLNGKIIESESYYLTEEEYLAESQIEPLDNCTDNEAQACYQTSYKRITLLLSNNRSSKWFSTFTSNIWLKQPNVKSVDVIAIRHNGSGLNITTFWGKQHYLDSNNQPKSIDYQQGGTNSQMFSNGAGISMNLVDAGHEFANLMAYSGYYTNDNITFYASYQHAQSDISVADSKKYNLSSSGLGGVINFTNASIRSKYDGMQGISYLLSNV